MKTMKMDNCESVIDSIAEELENGNVSLGFDMYGMLNLAKMMAKESRTEESIAREVQRPLKEGVIVRKDSELAIVVEDCGEQIAVIEYVYYYGKNHASNELIPIESGQTAAMWDVKDCLVVHTVE